MCFTNTISSFHYRMILVVDGEGSDQMHRLIKAFNVYML